MVARTRVLHQRARGSSNMSWGGVVSATAAAVAATSKVSLVEFVLNNQGIDETILRTRGVLTFFSQTPTVDRFVSGAIGMIVVSDEAAAAGAASIPGPVTDIDNDNWFVHETFMHQLEFGDATGRYNSGIQFNFDSKAKRIIHSGSTVLLMVENPGALQFNIGFAIRVLTKVRGT